jgi:hypothetical protein
MRSEFVETTHEQGLCVEAPKYHDPSDLGESYVDAK